MFEIRIPPWEPGALELPSASSSSDLDLSFRAMCNRALAVRIVDRARSGEI